MSNRILSLIAAMVLTLSAFAVDIETSRTWYLAGEAMEISVTDDDAIIAYAELCDSHGLAAGVAVGLKEGHGTGVLELPSHLHSGYYVLSVYSRHNAQVSHKLIAVVNPLRKSKDDDIQWIRNSHPDSLSYSSIAEGDGFSMADLVSEKAVDIREIEGHIIKARVENSHDGKTFSGSQIRPSLSIVGKQIHYFEGQMVNDSMAVFYTYGIHGKRPLVLSAMSSTGVSLPIEMTNPYATLLPKKLPHLVFHYKRSEVESRSIDMQRHQKAMASDVTLDYDYDETVFGTRPDQTYNLDEYRQFRTIREVLLEYVTCVTKKKINDVSQLFVRKEQDQYNTSLPTLVLIDGMPVFDVERLMKYDARRIHYINIYTDQFTFGNTVYNGILTFITRSGRLTNYPIEQNMQYLEYDFPK